MEDEVTSPGKGHRYHVRQHLHEYRLGISSLTAF